MRCPIPADCLNESLEDNKITLRSCLLVSRFWCKLSVRDVWNFIFTKFLQKYQIELGIGQKTLTEPVKQLFNRLIKLNSGRHYNLARINVPIVRANNSGKPPFFGSQVITDRQ